MGLEPLHRRLEAFGARVFDVDGHDLEALVAPTHEPWDDRPLFVIARTDPCRKLDLMKTRAPFLHYVRFKSEDEMSAYQKMLDSWNSELKGEVS